MYFFIPALSLGILGSFHCLGMCGPIALSVPLRGATGVERVLKALTYNAGRVLTYAILGFIFGAVGKSFVIAGYQQTLSIFIGIAMLTVFFLPVKYFQHLPFMRGAMLLSNRIKALFGNALRQTSYQSTFILGAINGLLPCGLVYLGVAGAIATGDVWKGALFMAAFGAGTLPAMLFVHTASQWVNVKARTAMRKAIPVFVVVSSCMLVLRGMNLGIPYISPQLSSTDCTQHTCCHKK